MELIKPTQVVKQCASLGAASSPPMPLPPSRGGPQRGSWGVLRHQKGSALVFQLLRQHLPGPGAGAPAHGLRRLQTAAEQVTPAIITTASRDEPSDYQPTPSSSQKSSLTQKV